ncbi:MAG: hypothetical protein IJ206_09385 [Oscillospiraceae bacterium]|nr:hypothetical protein [Oscillospiraceae bacterium]
MGKLNELLFNILTIGLIVWLWGENGHCIYAGGRMEALEKYGECRVTGWRIDGNQFRANIITNEVERDGRKEI